MAVTIQDIAWVAGLLEGEGCFSCRTRGHNPQIQLVMTDSDVVVRAAQIMGAYRVVIVPRSEGLKTAYRMNLYGRKAMQWMMTIYVLMGERRQAKIRDCLDSWKSRTSNYPERKNYSRGGVAVWEAAHAC